MVYKPAHVQLKEIAPFILKERRAKKHLQDVDHTVSWKAVQEQIETRSVDDIRNFWASRVVPLFDESQAGSVRWTEEMDLELLKNIV